MAIRKMRTLGDDILRERSKEVKEMNLKTRKLIHDMEDTLYDAGGVGLAAVQVGVLKRIFIIDIGEGLTVFINPEIIETDGSQTGYEGCLSIPGKSAKVERPNYVKVRAYDMNMNPFEMEGYELMARAICHEYDHLDATLYIDKACGPLINNEDIPDEEFENQD